MPTRFTTEAREVVEAANAEAGRRGDGWLGTEHLLLGLLLAGGEAAAPLEVHGLHLDDVRARVARHLRRGGDLDADALAAIGVDLAAVRAAAEARFGRGALDRPHHRRRPRLTRRAAAVLHLALREAKRAGRGAVTANDLLLGLLGEGSGLATTVMAETGADLAALRAAAEAFDEDAA